MHIDSHSEDDQMQENDNFSDAKKSQFRITWTIVSRPILSHKGKNGIEHKEKEERKRRLSI